MPRTLYLDCGANAGSTLRAALAEWPDAEAVAIEPNPRWIPSLRAIASEHPDRRIEVFHAAAWTTDADAPFFLTDSPHDPRHEGATLMAGKTKNNVDYTRPLRVPTLDLARWLLAHASPNDRVILKMDIEGAEYPVLEHLLATGAIARVAELRAEFHAHKVLSIDAPRHDRLLRALDEHFAAPAAMLDDKHTWRRPPAFASS